MRSTATKLHALCSLLPCLGISLPAASQTERTPVSTPTVVVLYEERDRDIPGAADPDESLVGLLNSRTRNQIEIYREETGLSRFALDPGYAELLAGALRSKYSGMSVDAVVAVLNPAFEFLVEYGDTIFPGAPILGSSIRPDELSSRTLPPRATVVLTEREYAPTLDIALSLHPETAEVVVVAGTGESDLIFLGEAVEELRPYEDRIRIRYLTDLPMDTLLNEVSQLSPGTIVLYSTIFQDGEGRRLLARDAAAQIASAASVPVYAFHDRALGQGIVGGYLYGGVSSGETAAGLVLEILAGEQLAGVYADGPRPSRAQFDWRQLRRWEISEEQLPEGSVVRFQSPSLWESYRSYVILAILVAVTQSLLIGGLMIQSRKRRLREAELRASENAFREMADTVPVMIRVSDAAGSCLWANRRWLDFVGRSLEQETGTQFAKACDPEDEDRVANEYRAAADGRKQFTVECRVRRSEGDSRWVLSLAAPRFAADGDFDGYVESSVDIHDQRLAEAELSETRAELAHVSRVSIMGELAASLAHELNQPLTAILGNAEAAREIISRPGGIDEVRDCLEDIVQDNRRAAEIISQLRGLSKKAPPKPVSLDLRIVIRDVLLLVETDARHRDVRVESECEDGLPWIEADRTGLQQALLNLSLNGIAAIEEAGAADRRIIVSARRNEDGMVEVSVRDTGQGLSREAMDRWFEPFFTTRPDGLGMGLAVSRKIIESFGGRLWAENNPRGGATFCFTLPVAGP